MSKPVTTKKVKKGVSQTKTDKRIPQHKRLAMGSKESGK